MAEASANGMLSPVQVMQEGPSCHGPNPPGVTTQSSCDRNGERGNALFGGLVSHFSWTGSSYPFRFSSPTRVARGMDEGNSACMMDKGLPCPDLVGDQSGLDSDRLRKPTPHRALS